LSNDIPLALFRKTNRHLPKAYKLASVKQNLLRG
jgi:hypothetical protein